MTPHTDQRPVWVLDTNVLLDWLIFKDPQIRPLAGLIEAGQICLVSRSDCREEFIRVLSYPELKADAEKRSAALVAYDRWHVQINTPTDTSDDKFERQPSLPLCSDTDDQKFLELARDAKAHWLVSKDKAVLKLAKPLQLLGLFEILSLEQAALRIANESIQTIR